MRLRRTCSYDSKVTEYYIKYSDKTKKIQIEEELEEDTEEGEAGSLMKKLAALDLPNTEQGELSAEELKHLEQNSKKTEGKPVDGLTAYEAGKHMFIC